MFREGRLLITKRYAKAHLGGFWEFPGGKREPNESFEACLVRCDWLENEPQPIGCEAVEWITTEELKNYSFPAADARLLEMLSASREIWKRSRKG